MNPLALWKGLEKQDRYMLISTVLVPISVWWVYIGRKKYGTKGMK